MVEALEKDILDLEGDSLRHQLLAARHYKFEVMLDHLRTLPGDIPPVAVAGHKMHCLLQVAADRALDSVLPGLVGRRGQNWHLFQSHMLVQHNGVSFDCLHRHLAVGQTGSLHTQAEHYHIVLADLDHELDAHKKGVQAAVLPFGFNFFLIEQCSTARGLLSIIQG